MFQNFGSTLYLDRLPRPDRRPQSHSDAEIRLRVRRLSARTGA